MRKLAILFVLLMTTGCGSNTPAPPKPNPGPTERITGSERIGWDQLASSTDELATFRYHIFVDENRSEVAGVACATTASAAGFSCSGRLPAMSPGAHALQMSTFVVRDGETLESERSVTLNVVVAAPAAAAAQSSALRPGAILDTPGGGAFRVTVLVSDLQQPTDLAVAADGRVMIAEATGRISIVAGGKRRTALEPDSRAPFTILALALDPQFARNGLVYVVRVGLDEAPAFQIVRYREVAGTLGESATLLGNVPASIAEPAAALRFGPDGRLYAAFEDLADTESGERGFNGKVLRLNPDGSTPRDQRGGSPVLAAAARRPRGLGWDAAGTLWIVDRDVARAERLIVVGSDPVRRASSASFTLPVPFGASSAVFHSTGDLLIGAETGRYVLRVRFDPANRQRVLSTERLLEGTVDAVRAVAVTPDGSLYVCTNAALLTLTARRG